MNDKCSSCKTGCSSGTCSTDPEDRLPPGILSRYDLNLPIADGILVWMETVNDGTPKISDQVYEVLGKALELDAGRVFGIIFGDVSVKGLYDDAFEHGVDTLYHIRSPDLNEFHPEAYAEALREVSERIDPSLILMSATPRGNEVASLAADSLGKNVLMNCTELRMTDGMLTATHPMPGGSGTVTSETSDRILTLTPGTFRPSDIRKGRKGTAINMVPSEDVRRMLSRH